MAVDAMTFRNPVSVGDVMCIYTDLIRIGNTSVTVYVEAWVIRRKQTNRLLVTVRAPFGLGAAIEKIVIARLAVALLAVAILALSSALALFELLEPWKTLVSIVLGGLLSLLGSFVASERYYRKATEDLSEYYRKVTADLREQTDELLVGVVNVINNRNASLEWIPGKDGKRGSIAVGAKFGSPAPTSDTCRP